MTSLLRSLLPARRSTRDISTVDDYALALGMLGFPGYGGVQTGMLPGLTGTWGQQTVEPVANSLESYARVFGSNGVVFSCMSVRLSVFSTVRFQWQRINRGRPSELFGTAELAPLEEPWVNGTTQGLLARMIMDVDLAGNSYWTRVGGELVRLRPDWTQIMLAQRMVRQENGVYAQVGWERLGYAYWEGGVGASDPAVFLPENVAHFAPMPDPLATYRGMSWLTPVLREIQNDGQMERHRSKFFENAATPSLSVSLAKEVRAEAFRRFKELMEANHRGVDNAYRTLYLGGGADVKVIGADFAQMDFSGVQGHAETRIAAAANVPPVIVGLSEGLKAATYCLPYSEPVWTPAGRIPIGELRAGDWVWSFVDGTLAPRRVTWQGAVGEKPVYTIRTKNRVLHATGNHPLLVRRPGSLGGGSNDERRVGLRWMRVDELQPGDRVVQAQRLPDVGGDMLPTGEPATTRLLQWLGAYTGDGSGLGNHRSAIALAIPPTDRVHEHYLKLSDELFRPRTIGVQERQFRFSSLEAKERLLPLDVHGAATKRVPGWIFGLRRDLRLAYLAGLVDTDGSVDARGSMTLALCNEQLVEDAKALLVSCGIQVSNVRHQVFKAEVLPQPGLQDAYDSYSITASSAVEVAEIPFADQLYRDRVDANAERQRRGGLDGWKAGLDPTSLGFYTVRSVEEGSAETVYDITVDGGHSFVAAGIVVHNSNYGQARRRFADGTMHPLWQDAAGSLAPVVDRPATAGLPGATRLWYDARDVPFLREDRKDAASIAMQQGSTMRTLVEAGWEPDAVVRAVTAEDYGLLLGAHTGVLSVQLQPPATGDIDEAPDEPDPPDDDDGDGADKENPDV